MIGWLTPQILFGTVSRYGVSSAEAGLLTFVELMTLSIGLTFIGARPPKRFSFRQIALFGLVVLIAGNAASYWMPSFTLLILTRCMTGMAAAIINFVVVSLISMKSAHPDRNFSMLMLVAIAFGAIILSFPSFAGLDVHGLAFLPFTAVVMLLSLPCLLLIPANTRITQQMRTAKADTAIKLTVRQRILLAFILIITVVVSFVPFMDFTFFPAIAAHVGLSQSSIDRTLGAATLAAIAGPILATLSVRWLGRWWSLLVAAVLIAVSSMALTATASAVLMGPFLMIALASMYFACPILLGWSAEIDTSGRAATITMGTMGVACAITPSLAGVFVDHFGLGALPFIVTVGSILMFGAVAMLRLPASRHVIATI